MEGFKRVAHLQVGGAGSSEGPERQERQAQHGGILMRVSWQRRIMRVACEASKFMAASEGIE